MAKDPLIDKTTQVAVLGASGFIGRHIVQHLSRRERTAVQEYSYPDIDFTQPFQVEKLKEQVPPGSMWVMAAAVTGEGPDSFKTLEGNARLAENMARLIEGGEYARLVFLSSVDMYGRNRLTLPLSERSPIRPESYYGISKAYSEQVLARACRKRDVPLTVFRLPGVYGPNDPSRRIVSACVEALLRETRLTVSGDGSQKRDLLYAGDVGRLVELAFDQDLQGVFNAVTGKSASLNELLHILVHVSGRKLKVCYTSPQEEPYDLEFELSALRETCPDFELTSLEKGLKATYDHAERNDR